MKKHTMKRTRIEDLPAPEKELTEEEAEKVKGGLAFGDTVGYEFY